jgi:tRNA threonylcarbamoyladenosine biosynthesis protein TsaE
MKTDMDSKNCIIYGPTDIDSAAHQLIALFDQAAVFTFTGTLGAGKTTLVSAMLASCGVTEPITSPTFTYMNVYHTNKGQTFYHFDCYRLSSLDEFLMAGFDEFLYQPNSWAFIEWPEIIMPLLTHQACHVTLDYYQKNRQLCYQLIP